MNKSLILNKIKIANNFKKDTELAEFLGISKYVLSNWRGRDTIDWELVLSKCLPMDFNWLLKEVNDEILKKENEVNENENIEVVSLSMILKKYQDLAIEYGYLKKENEALENKIEELEGKK